MEFKSKLIALFLILGAINGSYNPLFGATKQSSEETGYKEIHAKELKSWIDSGKQIEIVDARPKKYDEGYVIPGAKFLPYDSNEMTITKTLPSKDSIIVAYCASSRCPASTYLSNQLVQLGYKYVYKYPEGLADWSKKGYATQKAK